MLILKNCANIMILSVMDWARHSISACVTEQKSDVGYVTSFQPNNTLRLVYVKTEPSAIITPVHLGATI